MLDQSQESVLQDVRVLPVFVERFVVVYKLFDSFENLVVVAAFLGLKKVFNNQFLAILANKL